MSESKYTLGLFTLALLLLAAGFLGLRLGFTAANRTAEDRVVKVEEFVRYHYQLGKPPIQSFCQSFLEFNTSFAYLGTNTDSTVLLEIDNRGKYPKEHIRIGLSPDQYSTVLESMQRLSSDENNAENDKMIEFTLFGGHQYKDGVFTYIDNDGDAVIDTALDLQSSATYRVAWEDDPSSSIFSHMSTP